MVKRLALILVVAFSCLSVAFWYARHYKSGFRPQQVAKQIEQNVALQLNRLNETAATLRIAPVEDARWAQSHYPFLLLDSTGLLAWTHAGYFPEAFEDNTTDSLQLLQLSRGDFLLRKWFVNDHQTLVGVLPLVERFKVNNEYLRPTWNPAIFPIENIQVLPAQDSVGLAVGNGFKIGDEFVIDALPFDWGSFAWAMAGLLLLITAIILIVQWAKQKGWFDISFLLLLTLLLFLRLAMIQVNFPAALGYWSLFDPQKFASSWINVSLGDFLLNSLVVAACSAYLFAIYPRLKLFEWLLRTSPIIKTLASALFLTLALFAFLFPFLFYEIIFHNSSIRLDVTQFVFFDSLRVIAFLCVLLGTFSSFVFCHVAITYARHLITGFKFFVSLGSAIAVFLLYAWASDHDYTMPLLVAIAYLLMLFVTNLPSSLSKAGFVTFSYFLLAACAYSSLAALSIRYFSREATLQSQLRFATNNLVNHDILGEFILFDASKKIAQDPFIQSRFSNPFLSKAGIRERVQQLYINPYFDRYDVAIQLYNVAGQPIANSTDGDLVQSIQTIQNSAVKTEYEGVYWLKEFKSIKRYISIVSINKGGPLGYVLIDLRLKRLAPHSVYPELLLDNRFAQFVNTEDFSYGFFARGQWVASSGDFNYRQQPAVETLSNASLFREGISAGGYHHIALENDEGEVVVVSAKVYRWYDVLANFSFWFVLGLMLVFCWMVGYALLSLYRGYKPTYAARIQLYVYGAFILPLVVLAVATVSISNQTYKEEQNEQIASRSEALTESIAPWLEMPDSVRDGGTLSQQLAALSKSSQTDVSLFDARGELLATSQPLIFENQLQTRHLNRQAFHRVAVLNENYVVCSEQIGKLQYSSSYRAVRGASGELLGVVNFPFFQSARANEKSQALVVGNIMVVFVVVFLLFNFISMYAVNWLTFPLKFITRTLGATTLTGKNNPLQWKSNDEIGMMVTEYNRMLQNLENSKAELARTQKESAWREMAQQVAHEIKNPLTPMKLTLQRMELNAGNGSEDKKRAIKTLLQQVEILDGIASSFSSFAKMPVPILNQINLVQTVAKAVALYAQGASGKVLFTAPAGEWWVMGDEQLLIRIFSNLIINGLQANPDESAAKVVVSMNAGDQRAIISFADNGVGISEEVMDKIFIPSFSTKKSGSGLGLAIAKQGIEHMNGKIWFETKTGIGSTFYIELPLINQ
jgi:two-component system, NtrC family, nitrogen regulation sensor histidine kinase NtrY